MPSQPGPINGRNYALQWVRINDFSPGCYDGGHISLEQPYLSAPLGAAYLPQTYCCAVQPGNTLGPLPALVSTRAVSTIGGLPGTSTTALIAGFIITPQLNDGSYEVITILEADDGTNHYYSATSWLALGAVLNTISGPTLTCPTQAGFFGAPYPAWTRLPVTGAPGAGLQPILTFPTAVATDPVAGSGGHLWVYPHLANPALFQADDLITGATPVTRSSVTGQVFTYGNRIICLVGQNYTWPAGTGINTNENFNYTDPPETTGFGNQDTIFAIESPWGYGAYGTISVGEAFFVKKHGGGVILNGDINVPSSIIRMPGVQPTGDFVGQACATNIGLVYCSQNMGAWVWNGNNTAQKISRNISDSFFDLETGNLASNNYGYNVYQWQKWIMFSNNVCYDTDTSSWWQLFPKQGTNVTGLPNGRNIWWYCVTQNNNQIGVSPLLVTSNADPWLSIFDNTVPSPSYQWQSLPINVEQHTDRVLDVRQVVIRASDPTVTGSTGGATVKVTIDAFTATSTKTITNEPTTIRFNVGTGASGIQDLDLTLFCNNSVANGAAPIIHSIDIGYQVRAGVVVND
jgi:hypothetical protein